MTADTYTVERSVTIAAPPERIYEHIADFHQWVTWSPWEGVDPDLERTYTGAESGTGAVYGWSGNRRAGRGRMQIVEAERPSRVRIDLSFEKPFKARNDTVFTIVPTDSGARVTWWMSGKQTLVTKVMGVFKSMEDFLGPDFDRGLAQLKTVAEQPAHD